MDAIKDVRGVRQAEALGAKVGPAGLPLGVVLLAFVATVIHTAPRP